MNRITGRCAVRLTTLLACGGLGACTVPVAAMGPIAQTRDIAVLVEPAVGALPPDSLLPGFPRARARTGFVRVLGALPRSGAIRLQLFDDVGLEVVPERVDVDGEFVQWLGRVRADGPDGADNRVVMVDHEGRLTVSIRYGGRGYEVISMDEERHIAVEIDLDALPPSIDSIPGTPPIPRPIDFRPFLPRPRFQPPSRVFAPWWPVPVTLATCSDEPDMTAGPLFEVRLLFLYTSVVASTTGDVEGEIRAMVYDTNSILRDSYIPVRLAVAGSQQVVRQDDIGTTFKSHLEALVDPTDGSMDGVPDLKTRLHADVGVLLVEKAAGGGRATRLNEVTLAAGSEAFLVVKRGNAITSLNFAHELGHALGGEHQRSSSSPLMQPYSYNYAHVLPTGRTTVLGTSPGDRIGRYSNTTGLWGGDPLGIPSTDPTNSADVGRALRNTAAVTAAFRTTPVWFWSAGASTPWSERRVADEPVEDLLFGDFDGDGETDALRVDAATGTWWWSRSGTEPWKVRNGPDASLAVPSSHLAVGDFDADDQDDVIYPDAATTTWWVSDSATGGWLPLNGPDPSLTQSRAELAFVDFDGGPTDVFRVDVTTGTWFWVSGGTGSWASLNGPDPSLSVAVQDLRFGAFDALPGLDVLREDANRRLWISSGGTGAWSASGLDTADPGSLLVGDFDGDGTDDLFKATGSEWVVSYQATGTWDVLWESCHVPPNLVLGDFDGDGTTDVLRLGRRP